VPEIHPKLVSYLRSAKKYAASDLHIVPQTPPNIRQDGKLKALVEAPLTPELTREMILSTLSPEKQRHLDTHGELDYAISLEHQGRFRVNAYRAQGNYEAVIRLLSNSVKSLKDLGLPDVARSLALEKDGLVLVAGETGSGKSTSLASMIDLINNERTKKRIFTIENPVEIIHTSNRALISQREVGIDTDSFSQALRSVLRQDPDVILIGEIRDKDTAEVALQAAQTGHLVLSTIHAGSAEETVNRYVNLFPPEDRDNMRQALAITLKGVLVQQLVVDKQLERMPALEVMVNTLRVRRRISGETSEPLKTILEEGGPHQMQSLEQDLVRLVQNNRISPETALMAANNRRALKLMLTKVSLINQALA
jgi:twitching motility protein PilT